MNDDVIVIRYAQHGVSGDTTLATNIAQLLDAQLFQYNPFLSASKADSYTVNLDEIKDAVQPKCVLLLATGGNEEIADVVFSSVANAFPDAYRIFIECDRLDRRFKKYVKRNVEEHCHEIIRYSEYESFNSLASHVKDTVLDINIYQFGDHEPAPLSQRRSEVVIRGRHQGLKGTPHLYAVAEQTGFLDHNVFDELMIRHDGVSINVNSETGRFSGSIGMIAALCTDIKTHDVKPHLAVAPAQLAQHRINVFGPYTPDTIHDIANVVTLLAPVQSQSHLKDNNRINNKLEREACAWRRAMEYVNIEAIDYFTPVLFSRRYLELYEPALLETDYWYDWLEDIPGKLEWLVSDDERFARVATRQREIMVDKQATINSAFIEHVASILERV